MNSTHLHLLLNHFPIIGTLIGGGLLLAGIFRKNYQLCNSALVLLSIMALIAIPVYLTGEPAEETVEKINGISESMIEAHESAAKIAIWLMMATGFMAFISFSLQLKSKTYKPVLNYLVALFTLICFTAMARTGYLGGQIRHTEISSNSNINANGIDTKDKAEEADND